MVVVFVYCILTKEWNIYGKREGMVLNPQWTLSEMQLCTQRDDSLSPIPKDEIPEKFLGLSAQGSLSEAPSANEQGLMRLAREVTRSGCEGLFAQCKGCAERVDD